MTKIKYIMVLISCIITSLLMCSCNSEEKNNVDKETINASGSQTQVSIQDAETTSIPETTFSKEDNQKSVEISEEDIKYIFYRDVVSADDVFKCSYYTMPEKINDADYHISQMKDEESVWVNLFSCSEDKPVNEQGIYNFINGTYTKVLELIPDKTAVLEWDDNFLITKINNTDSSSICYYDIAQNKTSEIFTFSNEPDNETWYSQSDMVIFNNKVYFEVRGHNNGSIISWIYCYDISTQNLEMCREDAQTPMSDGNTVYAVCKNEENSKYEIIQSITPDNDFSYNFGMEACDITCTGGNVFTEDPGDRRTGSIVRNNITRTDILEDPVKDEGSFKNLKCYNGYLYWSGCGGFGNRPCLYDITNDRIVEFDKMPQKNYLISLKDGMGFVFHPSESNDICIFRY